jgi:hypothetical protein
MLVAGGRPAGTKAVSTAAASATAALKLNAPGDDAARFISATLLAAYTPPGEPVPSAPPRL